VLLFHWLLVFSVRLMVVDQSIMSGYCIVHEILSVMALLRIVAVDFQTYTLRLSLSVASRPMWQKLLVLRLIAHDFAD
jgi:hypothetical protein